MENLKSGFVKCGISPLERNKVLSRLPEHDNSSTAGTEELEQISERLDDSLVDMLKSRTGKDQTNKKRCRKMSFKPGMSISITADSFSSSDDSSVTTDPTSDAEVTDGNVSSATESNDDTGNQSTGNLALISLDSADLASKKPTKGNLKVSDWIVVTYCSANSSKATKVVEHKYVGQILKVISNSVIEVTFMRPKYSPACRRYHLPAAEDKDYCDFQNVNLVLPQPTLTRRGEYLFS